MTYTQLQQTFFLAILIVTSGVFLWMLGEYLWPVFWAVVLAIVFYPWHQHLVTRFRERSLLASLTTITIIILLVAIPLSVVVTLVAQESYTLYQNLAQNSESNTVSFIEKVGTVVSYIEPLPITPEAIEEKLRSVAAQGSEFIATSAVSFGQITFKFAIHTAIAVYLLFFMLKDGPVLRRTLLHYLPLPNGQEERLLRRFVETTRAVVQGTLMIAILQGVIGGTTFWLLGIGAPVLWGVAMAILAIIPAIGPALVWFPASVILILTGSVWQGVTLLVVGALLVSVIDEFLRPILVGRKAKMPDAVVLLATIGGIASFGISGFVVGPIIAAFFISLWVMFEEKYHKELSKK